MPNMAEGSAHLLLPSRSLPKTWSLVCTHSVCALEKEYYVSFGLSTELRYLQDIDYQFSPYIVIVRPYMVKIDSEYHLSHPCYLLLHWQKLGLLWRCQL